MITIKSLENDNAFKTLTKITLHISKSVKKHNLNIMRQFSKRQVFLNVLILFLLASLCLPVNAQSDSAITETPPSEMLPTATLTATATETPQSIPSETNTEVVLPTTTATPSSEPTATTAIVLATLVPSVVATASLEITPEFTQTAIPPIETSTLEATLDQTFTETLTATPTYTPQSESTEILEITMTATAEATFEGEITETVEATEALTPFETPTKSSVDMMKFMGTAHYQKRLPDNSGIQIEISNASGIILNTVTTDSDGFYTVLAPSTEFFWLKVTAPSYLPFTLGIWPGEKLPDVSLAGGDIDGDGCIGTIDLALLTANFGSNTPALSDINGDGQTNASDLAILAGNYDPDSCLRLLEVTPTATVTETDSSIITATVESTEPTPLTPEVTPGTEGSSH